MLNVKVNESVKTWVDIETENGSNYIEFESEGKARFFANEVELWIASNPRFKKECYYIKTFGGNELVYGYKVDGVPFAVRKKGNWWYVDHYYSGLSVGLCGTKTRVQAIENAIYVYARLINENLQFERIN